jgi:hypothetical protein
VGYVARTGRREMHIGKFEGRRPHVRPHVRPNRRWEENITIILRIRREDVDWTNLAQNSDTRWRSYERDSITK